MSFAVPGLVETSTNLASVKFVGEESIVVTSSQRSSVEDESKVMEMYFNYANTFGGKHKIDLMAGYSWQEDYKDRTN